MNADRLIGLDNDIPWHYPEDFKRFKRVTLGSAIIMGRKTWESIGSKPLPKRQNIVLTRGTLDGIENASTIDAALKLANEKTVWFIGGGYVYQQALPYCTLLDITWIPDQININPAQNPVYFPDIDPTVWQAEAKQALKADSRLFVQRFQRKNPR